MFAQIPGTDWALATSGILVQRSGLVKREPVGSQFRKKDETNLNSAESSPHIDLSRLMGFRVIGMNIV